jgi:hypothetical protein
VTERQVLRGFLANIEVLPPLIVTFQFNPASIRDTKEPRFSEGTCRLAGPGASRSYTGGGARTISFDLKLDGLEEGTNPLIPGPLDNGISTELAKLRSFVYPQADAWALVNALFGTDEGQRITAPPRAYFGFGLKILECVVTSINITETQFNSLLAPVRADVSVTLVVVEEDDNLLYEADKLHRNLLSALGLANVSIF